MNSIFSNRFFQGGITIAVIGMAFFAYQSFTSEIIMTDVDAADAGTLAGVKIETRQIYVSEDSKIETAKITSDSKENIISNENIVEKTTK